MAESLQLIRLSWCQKTDLSMFAFGRLIAPKASAEGACI